MYITCLDTFPRATLWDREQAEQLARFASGKMVNVGKKWCRVLHAWVWLDNPDARYHEQRGEVLALCEETGEELAV